MATQADLDAAVAAFGVAISKQVLAVTKIDSDVDALIAKISASPAATDFQAEVDALTASQNELLDSYIALGTAHSDAAKVLTSAGTRAAGLATTSGP